MLMGRDDIGAEAESPAAPGTAPGTAPGAAGGAAPTLAWPAQISQEFVLGWVKRRLPGAEQVRTELYHHPMMGVAFRWRRPLAQPMLAHALVDLVGGRAFAADHWEDVGFRPIDDVPTSSTVKPPKRLISDDDGRDSARRLINGVLLRRRRLDLAGRLEEIGEPLIFGKPNWWVQATHGGKAVEVVIDGLSGNHYVFSA